MSKVRAWDNRWSVQCGWNACSFMEEKRVKCIMLCVKNGMEKRRIIQLQLSLAWFGSIPRIMDYGPKGPGLVRSGLTRLDYRMQKGFPAENTVKWRRRSAICRWVQRARAAEPAAIGFRMTHEKKCKIEFEERAPEAGGDGNCDSCACSRGPHSRVALSSRVPNEGLIQFKTHLSIASRGFLAMTDPEIFILLSCRALFSFHSSWGLFSNSDCNFGRIILWENLEWAAIENVRMQYTQIRLKILCCLRFSLHRTFTIDYTEETQHKISLLRGILRYFTHILNIRMR